MSFEPQQEDTGTSPIIEAKSLLSNGDEGGAFGVLKKGAESGDVMACYDSGFMMIEGIGCGVDWRGGFELMGRGRELEEETEDMDKQLSVGELEDRVELENFDEEEPQEEKKEEVSDNTLEHDLFNLIDSMYDDKEE